MKNIFFKSILIISLLLEITVYSANLNYKGFILNQDNTAEKIKFSAGTNISSEKAKKIALSHARVAERDAKITKIQLGVENGIAVYEIEFYVNGKKFEYDVNSNSGEIVKFR